MKYVYLHKCEGYSQRWYESEEKAFKACIRKYKLPYSFGLPKYVNTRKEYLLSHLKNLIETSKTQECREKAEAGVYNQIEILEIVEELRKLLD